MCGIIAYTGQQTAAPILLHGLRRLEYRGYDSAGITVHSRKKLNTWKAAGKIAVLESQLPTAINGNAGIGHTRWATHGAPTASNAHPHLNNSGTLSLVHNGIIENASTLKECLLDDGIEFQTETDTEILVHLISKTLDENKHSLIDAVRYTLTKIVGTYGIAAVSSELPQSIVLARNGSPVILGIGQGEMLAASDMSALSRYTREVVHLDDGEIAMIRPDGFEVTTMDAAPANKVSMTLNSSLEEYDKSGHAHYLYKEILEQPETVQRALSGRLDHRFNTAHLGGLNLEPRDLLKITRIKVLGCGSALYAGMAGAHMIESLARIPAAAEAAAEFRYRNPVIEADTLYIVVSQSGETFDTLAATREIQRKGGFVLGIVNCVGSTIAREVDGGVYMHAGAEVSVASTKTYTSMLSVFALLAILFGRSRDVSPQKGAHLLEELKSLSEKITAVIAQEEHIAAIAQKYSKCHSTFFVGRTWAYPIALEGAQKLKEISYIHAEAYPASELKHGPLALVDMNTPCFVILPESDLRSKSIGTLEEIKARKAPVIAVTDSLDMRIDTLADHVIRAPASDSLVQGIVLGIALQLVAYHCALALKRDVDQPRNLAKSVTVE